jgi:hypothetical protein
MGRGALGLLTMEVARVLVLTSSRLRYVWLDRHAARDDVGSHTATSGILRRGRSTKALRQLLDESLGDIVHSDVHSVGNTKHDQ